MAGILKVDKYQDFNGNDIMTSDGAGTITMPNGIISGQNYPAFEAYLNTDQSITDATLTKVQCGTEVFDTDGCYDNSTNYRFTPTVAGKYSVYSFARLFETGSGLLIQRGSLSLYKNGSTYSSIYWDFETGGSSSLIRYMTPTLSNVVSMNGTTDYLEIFALVDTNAGTNGKVGGYTNSGNFIATTFGAYRIGA